MNVYQAIETHYVGPTNYRASRVIATTASGLRRVHQWDYSLNVEANHHAAAEALRAQLDWPALKAGGSTRRGFAWCTSTLEG